ncbi:MAG: helix-turn-helix transcriptional regulator [Proteobacteria bacterium]|nr:helix-turn-helix transcriptional regulator [Pseudomonadota bacterium]
MERISKRILDFYIPMVYITIMTAQDIKRWRLKNGFSQVRLAKHLNVATMTVSRWETGSRGVPPFLFLALKSLECERKRGGKHGVDIQKK